MMSTRSAAVRVFLSLWLIFSAHWATDFVREHFLVLSIVERGTFALDGFEDLHPDIFVHDDGHAYHGANPGISMIGAVPYFVLSPLVDLVVERELEGRPAAAEAAPQYDDPRAARREFYAEVRRRGLDVRFGLIGLVTQLFAMAPLSALGGSVFFLLLTGAGASRFVALGGTLLYAVGTPVFLRSAYLNQNLAVGIFGLIAFALLWNPGRWCGWSERTRYVLAGLSAGLALLCDYSGGLVLALLGVYALLRARDSASWLDAMRSSLAYVAGSVPPVLMLWYYQWAAFGFPFYPPQHYMPPVEWSDLGYQGVAGPSAELARMLLLDPRFGLLVTTPVVIFAVAAPLMRRSVSIVPRREAILAIAVGGAFLTLFSSVHYTRLQYITGIRYMVPVVPFLVLAAIPALLRLPRALTYGIVFLSVLLNWGFAMARPQELEGSIVGSLARAYIGGLQLPAFRTLSNMSANYLPGASEPSPSLVFLGLALVLALVWTIRLPWRPLGSDSPVSERS